VLVKRSLALAAVLLAACGLRAIPSPDAGATGGGGATAGGAETAGGGETAGGSTAGGSAAGGSNAGGSTAGGTGTGGGCMAPQDCPAPANATPACNAGVCTFVCNAPLLACGSACCAARSITAGDRHTCIATDQGVALCWGGMFAVGNGGTAASLTPTPVQGFGDAGVVAVSAGNVNTCGLTSGGAVKCWGAGPIGSGTPGFAAQATQTANLGQGVTSLSVGLAHACVVADGGAKCWGLDSHGEQGCNQMCQSGGPMQPVPGPVTGLAYDVKQVSCGGAHCCGLLDDGGVRCWGFNVAFECGDGTNTQRIVPVVAHAFDAGVDELFAGWSTTCARTGTALRCIGTNGDGELGNGMVSGALRYTTPVLLGPGLTSVGTSGVGHHACAVVDAGVWCWGKNDRGQLGDGLMTSQNRPVRVLGLNEPMAKVAVGAEHSCAMSVSGGVWCWGNNSQGQLGIGTMGGIQLAPQQVR